MDQSGFAMVSNLAIRITHINGGLFKLEPTGRFPVVKPGNRFPIGFRAEGCHVGRTDILPNWYITMPGASARVIHYTAGESLKFVKSFDKPEKWKRDQTDRYDPYSPENRFMLNEIEDIGHAGIPILPTPAQVTMDDSVKVKVTDEWVIVMEHNTREAAKFLAGGWSSLSIKEGAYITQS